MARPVDPVRHEARRRHVINAAVACLASTGFEATTTAEICRVAGIGSGTFFHYFPTKASVVIAAIDMGTAEIAIWFDCQREVGVDVIVAFVEQSMAELAHPHSPGFVRAVASVAHHPDIAAALRRDVALRRARLTAVVRRAQDLGAIRTDIGAGAVARWVLALIDGYVGLLLNDANPKNRNTDKRILLDLVRRFTTPPSADPSPRA